MFFRACSSGCFTEKCVRSQVACLAVLVVMKGEVNKFWFLNKVSQKIQQTSKDVLLDVDNVPEDFILFVWKFDKENSILATFYPGGNSKISKAYTGRIDHPEKKKYSVILKNLQETDSRVYSARVTTDYGDSTLVQHNIIGINQRSQTPALLWKSTCWMLQ
uniref:Immunoglobulin V-set domain-containing protein n=1 Tax=Salarias fasciatus TaxID=181472 RepID=A0A672JSE1_SALFA